MSVQGKQPGAETSSKEDSLDPWQTYFSKKFNNLFHRVGKIKIYKVRAEFLETLTPIHQTGRRVPITLQDRVDKEISKLLQQGRIEKLEEGLDKYFVSSIVITVKKNGSVKLALESKELIKQVHKNKFQMPNIEELMDTVGQTISARKMGMYILLRWILHTLMASYHLVQKRVFNAFFVSGGKSTGTIAFEWVFMASQPGRRSSRE